MKTWMEKGIDGRTITRMMPENEEDLVELGKMAEDDELDDRESFGDDPDVWEKSNDE